MVVMIAWSGRAQKRARRGGKRALRSFLLVVATLLRVAASGSEKSASENR